MGAGGRPSRRGTLGGGPGQSDRPDPPQLRVPGGDRRCRRHRRGRAGGPSTIPRSAADRPWRRPVAIAGVVAVLAWIQPVIDQFAGEGNLANAADGGRIDRPEDRSPPRRPDDRVDRRRPAVVDPLRVQRHDHVDRRRRVPASGWTSSTARWPSLPIAVAGLASWSAMLVLVIRHARRRRDDVVVALGAVAGRRAGRRSAVSMVLSPVNTIGLSPHQVRWLWPVALIVWAVPAGGGRPLGRAPRTSWSPWPRPPPSLFALANLPTHAAPEGPTADREYRPAVAALLDQIADYDPGQPVAVRHDRHPIRRALQRTGHRRARTPGRRRAVRGRGHGPPGGIRPSRRR